MRYILHPGWEVNRDNSERVYVSALELLFLYELPFGTNIRVNNAVSKPTPMPGDIHCRVSHEQDYPLFRKEPNGR